MSTLHRPPDTYAHHVRMARIYLHQAHETVHRALAFTLLSWAAERRLKAFLIWLVTPRNAAKVRQQLELFS